MRRRRLLVLVLVLGLSFLGLGLLARELLVRSWPQSFAGPPARGGSEPAVAAADKVPHARLRRLARPTGRKVLVVGWDGADWLVLRPLLQAGRLPNLGRLVERGVAGDLRSEEPLLSPLLWTTIATGKPVLEHGVTDFLVRDVKSGELTPISSAARKVHALWTILPAFGLRADVVAWWATWPAEVTGGTMVTDRVSYQLFQLAEQAGNGGKVHPPEAWEAVQRRLVAAEEIGWEEVRRFVAIDEVEFERRWRSLPPDGRQADRVNHLRKILAATKTYHRIALDCLQDQADLTMVYYEGTDTVAHLFARFLPPKLPGVADQDVQRFGHALPEFYAYADELLGELLARLDDSTIVLLVSDHGFLTGAARPAADPADFTSGAPSWHRLHGVLVAAGEGLHPGTLQGATIRDLAPTTLALLGLPVPRDLAGRALREVLPEGVVPLRPPELPSFEGLRRTVPQPLRASASENQERLSELVALGYLAPSVVSSQPRTTDADAVATAAYNQGRILQRQGDHAAAGRQFALAVERSPAFGAGWAALAQVSALDGRHCEAFEYLVRGFTKSRAVPSSGLTGLVEEANRCGRLSDAEWVLGRLRPGYEANSAYHAALGLLRAAQGRPDAALGHYGQALGLDPLDPLAIEESVSLLQAGGRGPEARALLERSFARARGQLSAMNQIAVVALRQGWTADAERLLREVLESDPGNPGVLANLATTLARRGARAEALATMREAAARDPDNATNYFNLGAMLADAGRLQEALESFETAQRMGLGGVEVLVAAAKMRFRLGDTAACRRDLERALRLEPDHREAASLLADLVPN